MPPKRINTPKMTASATRTRSTLRPMRPNIFSASLLVERVVEAPRVARTIAINPMAITRLSAPRMIREIPGPLDLAGAKPGHGVNRLLGKGGPGGRGGTPRPVEGAGLAN